MSDKRVEPISDDEIAEMRQEREKGTARFDVLSYRLLPALLARLERAERERNEYRAMRDNVASNGATLDRQRRERIVELETEIQAAWDAAQGAAREEDPSDPPLVRAIVSRDRRIAELESERDEWRQRHADLETERADSNVLLVQAEADRSRLRERLANPGRTQHCEICEARERRLASFRARLTERAMSERLSDEELARLDEIDRKYVSAAHSHPAEDCPDCMAWAFRAMKDLRPLLDEVRDSRKRIAELEAERLSHELTVSALRNKVSVLESAIQEIQHKIELLAEDNGQAPELAEAVLRRIESIRIEVREARKRTAELEREITATLDFCPHAIRVHEGGGPENLEASLAVTVAKMQGRIEELEATCEARVKQLAEMRREVANLYVDRPALYALFDRYGIPKTEGEGDE